MATLWNLLLVVSLLVLSAPQRCVGVDHGSLELREVKLLSAMQILNDALKCTSETTKEGLRLHEKNSEALKDLQSLPELVLMMREQMSVQNEMKKQLTDLHKEDAFSQENAKLKIKLENKDKMVDALSQEIAQLKCQLDNKDKMVRHLEESVAESQQLVSHHTSTNELLRNKMEELEVFKKDLEKKVAANDIKVQVLEKRIMEYQTTEEELKETLVQLNNTVAAWKKNADCALEYKPQEQLIKRLVQQFSNTKDWGILRRGLETVLDNSSEPYSQLQSVGYSASHPLWTVCSHGSTQLVSLLLDAGLPVDTDDSDKLTMLHGATWEGHLQLVKLLLDRGASVNVSSINAWTPLLNAARYGDLEIVQLLVSAGANTTVTNNDSDTALDLAKSGRHTAVVEYLQQLLH